VEDKRAEMAIKASQEMLARVEYAKSRGEIKDYVIYACADNPRIIDHISLIK
jgi:hypothetical protein